MATAQSGRQEGGQGTGGRGPQSKRSKKRGRRAKGGIRTGSEGEKLPSPAISTRRTNSGRNEKKG